MKSRSATLAVCGILLALSLCGLAACRKEGVRSGKIVCGDKCSDYQHTDLLPDNPSQGTIRLAIGGDSRDDRSGVVPWAFEEAKRRGVKAFFFLGDLELTASEDELFLAKLRCLGKIPFYPAMGNHEVETFGFLRLLGGRRRVKEFKKRFVKAPGISVAPLDDVAVYAADLEGGVHFIAMDNVSRRGEGFGPDQLTWLEGDLKSARAAQKIILVGMHKGLAHNPVTTHAMDEDGDMAVKDSGAALELFKKYKVAMVFVSHSHMYASYDQEGIQVRLTGGLGAPLVKGLCPCEGGFHHFLLVDLPPGESKAPLRVEVVRFQATATRSDTDESEEVE